MHFMSSTESNLSDSQRRALVDVLRSQPQATLEDLSSILDGPFGAMIKTLTLGELFGAVASSSRRSSSNASANNNVIAAAAAARSDADSSPAKKGARGKKKVSKPVNSRTAQGRRLYDASVLEALRTDGDPLSAGQLRDRVGGSDQQIRVSLQRLVDSKQVVRSGVARGTRYQAG